MSTTRTPATTAYAPGTVAKATVRGVPDVTVMAGYGTAEPRLRWLTTDERVDAYAAGWCFAFDVTDVRPLVVLDLDDAGLSGHCDVRRVNLLEHLRKGTKVAQHLADQIEAQTKPPRIPEPGMWGVVEASCRLPGGKFGPVKWVHTTRAGSPWYAPAYDVHVVWHDLIDPALVREGVEA